jgi:pantetheine-phosphate adenylyltransferase
VKRFAIYPGTFDPFTNGHLDIIKRGLKIFDNITVLLGKNPQKNTYFSLNERIEHITKVIDHEKLNSNVSVDSFEGLLVDYCKMKKIHNMIRGLRPLVDFEYEFEMAMVNRSFDENIETVFILTHRDFFYLRSSIIKDIIKLNGELKGALPECIKDEIIGKIKKNSR